MQTTREIKRRIKSIKNTKKITSAMELVATAKMRKAIAQVLASRPYAFTSWMLLKNLSVGSSFDVDLHPLLQPREAGKVCLVIMATDRGLCGGLNNNILRQAAKYLQEKEPKATGIKKEEADVVAIGKKAGIIGRQLGLNVIAVFAGLTNKPSFSDILPAVKMIISEYKKGMYGKVLLVYPDFVSALVQRPHLIQLLPLQKKTSGSGRASSLYIFEPDPNAVLEKILQQLIEVQLYQALLETTASEHSARMKTMRNATLAASEMITDLTLSFNQARQDSITAELTDISTANIAARLHPA